ncbi:hypothetical protein VTN77DRAFT_4239 [Rasamsonia byssochlamydoides]|uniref:uncharacterized protein n=1 Tax=Rasamsonia byssochlamydoides TaxID=89139 RepID=UPI0037435603
MRLVPARCLQFKEEGCLQLAGQHHRHYHYHPHRHYYHQRPPHEHYLPALRRRPCYDHHIHSFHQRRSFSSLLDLSSPLLPPIVFLGLGLTLWTYKCLMMILFQNKIIYMPNIPPFSRSEKVEDYARRCLPVRWREESVVTGDGVRISLLVGNIEEGQSGSQSQSAVADLEGDEDHLVVLYFQGNASSLPPRLPYLSDTIKMVNRASAAGSKTDASPKKTFSFVAVSYRGYWTSSGRASAKGIERDASAALGWILQRYANVRHLKIVLWGQSIGAGVATNAAAGYLESLSADSSSQRPMIDGMVLETPFTSVRDILLAFYPQKWLPYRYLTPFLRSHWDSEEALRRIAQAAAGDKPRILILEAGKDDVVPHGQAERIEQLCKSLGLGDVQRKTISGALHTELMAKADGRRETARFLSEKF